MGPQVMYLNLPPWQYIQNQTVLQKVDAFLGLVSRTPEKKRAKTLNIYGSVGLMQPSIWCLNNIIHRIQRDTMKDQVHIIYPLSGLVHRIGVCMDNACDLWLRSLRVSFVFFFNEFADWKFTAFIPFNSVVAIKIIATKSGVVAMISGVFLKYNYSNILYKEKYFNIFLNIK